MRIGIISDIHCRHSTSFDKVNTNLFSDKLRKPFKQHPVQSFLHFIDKEKLKVDYLICPGDITDKADKQGFITGWSFLEEMKEHLEAKELFASLGNHDVDSRKIHSSYDSFEVPKKIKDNFPFKERAHRDAFYANAFVLIKQDEVAFFVFNSVHSHTNATDAKNSIITDEMLEDIESELMTLGDDIAYKVAFTHHHPIKHSNAGFAYKDTDVIEKGEKLIELLEKYNFQVIIHGHKHEPRIVRYNSSPVFAAGSFSSLENLQETNSQNYFHILTLYPNQVKGYFENYEFTNMVGWYKASSGKLDHIFGFGANLSIKDFTESVDTHMSSGAINYLQYKDFIDTFPDFNCYLPTEQAKIIEKLQADHKIYTIKDRNHIKEIMKRV
jgi:predicted phosphodiesterase